MNNKEVIGARLAKNYKCKQCDYSSSEVGKLKRHFKTHSGEKSNQCNQCEYACSESDASALRTHLRSHSGQMTFKCNQYEYASIQATVNVTNYQVGFSLSMHWT